MPDFALPCAEVRMLDGGYSREARSLLYQAYRHEPSFAYLFDAARPGFDQRVRATVREIVRQHFLRERPALGLFVDDRMVGIALIAPPERRLEVTESWGWRLRMLLTTGFACTKRYLQYHQAVMSCLPPGAYHLLPLLGIHPRFQGRKLGVQLLTELHRWCAQEPHTLGLVLNTGNSRYVDYYKRLGYQELGEVAVGPIVERVFFYANPSIP